LTFVDRGNVPEPAIVSYARRGGDLREVRQREPGGVRLLWLLWNRPHRFRVRSRERKIVSVLFCDLVGFTTSSDEQDPEDVRARIRPYHARLRQEIERYDYTRQLPSMVRTALAVGDAALANGLVNGIEPRYPLDEHALCAARAQIAERADDRAEAAALYAEAARRWQEFGHVPERAFALLGQGRCLRSLELTGAEEPLREAAELFASMGYEPALAETAALLEGIGVPTP
jgi:class 3 adenylate cyclase